MKITGEQTARGILRIIPRAAQIHMAGLAGVSAPVGQVGGVPAVDGGGNAEFRPALPFTRLPAFQTDMAGSAGNDLTFRVLFHKVGGLVAVVHFQNGRPGVRVALGTAEAGRNSQHGGAFGQEFPGLFIFGAQRNHRIRVEHTVGVDGAHGNRRREKGILHNVHPSLTCRGIFRQPCLRAQLPRYIDALGHDLGDGRPTLDDLRVELRLGIGKGPNVVRRGRLVKSLQPGSRQHIFLRSRKGHIGSGQRTLGGQSVQHSAGIALRNPRKGRFFGLSLDRRRGKKNPAQPDQEQSQRGQPSRQGPRSIRR